MACSATVRWLAPVEEASSLSWWQVDVVEARIAWSQIPRARSYRLKAVDDDAAARVGIARFERDFSAFMLPSGAVLH